MLSSDVIQKLVESGLSSDAARQRVVRSKPEVLRLESLDFANRSKYLFLSRHRGEPIYWETLVKAIEETPLYSCSFNALKARGGTIPKWLFEVISGSPSRPLKGHKLSQSVLKLLLQAGVMIEYLDPAIEEAISLSKDVQFTHVSPAEIRADLLAESVLIHGVKEWIRKVGIVSYEKVDIRDAHDRPNFGQFSWDIVAPCYVYPFQTKKPGESEARPGFFVCDVILQKQLTRSAIEFFAKKCAVLRATSYTVPFMSMLLAEGYNKEALQHGKSKGIVITTPRNLLGNDVADALASLINILTRHANNSSSDSIYELFSKLSKIEGAARNLIGPFFELIVARIISVEHGGNTIIGKRVVDPANGKLVDIDVLSESKGREVRAYECKAKEPGGNVSICEVSDWLNRQVPRIVSWINSEKRFSGYEKYFELWTSGTFSYDAIELLRETRNNTKRYNIDWKSGIDVLEYADRQHESRLSDVLKEQFIKHPLVPKH